MMFFFLALLSLHALGTEPSPRPSIRVAWPVVPCQYVKDHFPDSPARQKFLKDNGCDS